MKQKSMRTDWMASVSITDLSPPRNLVFVCLTTRSAGPPLDARRGITCGTAQRSNTSITAPRNIAACLPEMRPFVTVSIVLSMDTNCTTMYIMLAIYL